MDEQPSAGRSRDRASSPVAEFGIWAFLLFLLGVFLYNFSDVDRFLLIALDASKVQAWCARRGIPADQFWQRWQAMGVDGVLLRPEPLSEPARRGGLFGFSSGELEQWKALGLVAPNTTLKPDTVWIKNRTLSAEVLAAASKEGVAVSTSVYAGYQLISFPSGFDWPRLAAYDPTLLPAAADAVVYEDAGEASGTAYLYRKQGEGLVGFTALATASAEGASSALRMRTASWPIGGSPRSLLSLVYRQPDLFLELRLPDRGVPDDVLAEGRSAIEFLRERRIRPGSSQDFPPEKPATRWRGGLCRALFWIVTILGPLFALRTGLKWVLGGRIGAVRWPMASPELQIIAGLGGVWIAAVFSGLFLRGLSDPAIGLYLPRHWLWWAEEAPLALGFLFLYRGELAGLHCGVSAPATYQGILKGLGFAAAALLVLGHRWFFARLSMANTPVFFDMGSPGVLWWLLWRWKEIFIGFPCLVAAFFAFNSKLDCPDCEIRRVGPLGDPRPWLLAGMLGPSGVMAAAASAGLPRSLALGQDAASAILGAVLGALALAAGFYWKSRCAARASSPQI